MLGEMRSNEHNNIHKSLRESIQTRQEHLKIQQEKQLQCFQLVIDNEKFIDRNHASQLMTTLTNYLLF